MLGLTEVRGVTAQETADVGELAQRASAGDHDAFCVLYRLFYDRIYWLIQNIVQNRAVAEDLTSETFLRAWKGIRNHGRGSFAAWLSTIAYRCIYTHHHRRREIPVGDPILLQLNMPPGTLGNPERELHEKTIRHALANALRQLKPVYRQCIVMRFFANMEVRDIAAQLGYTPGNMAVIHHRALNQLAYILRHGQPPKTGRPSKKEKQNA